MWISRKDFKDLKENVEKLELQYYKSKSRRIEEKEKREWLDNEIDKIMEKDIQKVIIACLQSGIPCDPETSDAIKEIKVCLERLKKGAEK